MGWCVARWQESPRRLTLRDLLPDHERRVMDQNGAGWNQVSLWLRQVAGLRQVA